MNKIDAKHVNFFYGDFQALKDISMTIEEKSVVAFIGPSGCGKSTFLRLFNRMNDLIPGSRLEGEILIDGRNIYDKSVQVDELRKSVGMVFQRPNPFPKSIFENVAYGLRVNGVKDNEFIRHRVEETLKGAALWDEVKNKLKELNHTLKVLDPAIKGIIKLNELEDTYAIQMGKEEILIKDGKILNPSMLSSGTKSGLDIAGIVASIKSDKHSFYYCDEKFSYVHSDIEKGFLSLMISLLKPNSQLFFTTHNLDILDLPLPKHSFNFLKKEIFEDDQVIKVINAADYLKKSTDSLRNAVDNDLFSVSPNLDLLYEIEDL